MLLANPKINQRRKTMGKQKLKQGVSKDLLELCAGSDLDQQRLAPRDSYVKEAYVADNEGKWESAEEWLKSKK